MVTQSEAALEQGLIKTLQDMSYEYVKIEEETNLDQNFKTQLEKHNKKELARHGRTSFTDSEFEKIKIHLEGGTRFEKAKKLRDLFPLELETGERVWVEFLNRQQWCQNEFQVSNQITVEGRKKCRFAFGSNRAKETWRGVKASLQSDTALPQDFVSWLV